MLLSKAYIGESTFIFFENSMMKLSPVEANAFKSLQRLLKEVGAKVTSTSLRKALVSHFDFPSLASLSAVLSEFNVPNLATNLSQQQLQEIPTPAIVHLNIEEGAFGVLIKATDNSVEWIHDSIGYQKESIDSFSRKWDGITLLIEPNEYSGEHNYRRAKQNELVEKYRKIFIIIGLAICLAFLIYPVFKSNSVFENLDFYGLLTTKSIGVALSIVLIWYSFDADNSFLNKICQLNKTTNCQNILSSEAASIGGFITWSEVGLVYFFGGFVSLLFFQKGTLTILQITSLFTLPYTVWSIYHQAFVAKVWCPLCLGVQALLWVEFFISLPISFDLFSIQNALQLGFCYLLVSIFWIFIKKPLKDSFDIEKLNLEFQKLKFNPTYIQNLLKKDSALPSFRPNMQMIKLGNFESEYELQMVLNPTCWACREKFLDIIKITEFNTNLKFQIILSSSDKDWEVSSRITRVVLGLANNTQMTTALLEWFRKENQDFDTWSDVLNLKSDLSKGESQRLIHKQWLRDANISQVPIMYFNKIELPIIYKVKEIGRLLNLIQT